MVNARLCNRLQDTQLTLKGVVYTPSDNINGLAIRSQLEFEVLSFFFLAVSGNFQVCSFLLTFY